MDTHYQRDSGVLKLSMESYVTTTMERFRNFDVSRGYPYKEALKVLKRVYRRREHGIVISRGAAGKELVPSSSRPKPLLPVPEGGASDPAQNHREDTGELIDGSQSEVLQKMLLSAQRVLQGNDYVIPDPDFIDIGRVILAENSRYRLVAYADASFAVGERKHLS
jgi:hypothetical protein